MTRSDFGGTSNDLLVKTTPFLRPTSGTLTFWSAASGGTQYTDLVLNGSPVTSITVGSDGFIPTFQGPDGITTMWADEGVVGGTRTRMVADPGAQFAALRAEAGWVSPLDYGAVPATAVPDVTTTASSATVSSPGGHFTPAMNGQPFHLTGAGFIGSSTSSRPWSAGPVVGTFTYVSPTSGTLSTAASQTVTGATMYVGPDASTAINAAVAVGNALLPIDSVFLVGSPIMLGSGQALRGVDKGRCQLRSVTPQLNVIVSNLTTKPTVERLTIVGDSFGSQPANTTPTVGQAPDHTGSGSGIIFAGTTGGIIRDVETYHCGGDLTTGHNGVAGIWITFGCKDTIVERTYGAFCRSHLNEDNFYNSVTDQPPFDNTFRSNTSEDCVFGFAADSGGNTRGLRVDAQTSRYCVQTGIEVSRSRYVTISNPVCEFNGANLTNAGIVIQGSSPTITCEQVTISNPMTFANGTHGIKIAEYAKFVRVVGGISARNFRSGVLVLNGASEIDIDGTTVRANGLSGETDPTVARDGVHVLNAGINIRVRVNAVDDQTTPTQRYGVRALGTSDSVFVDESSTFSGNATAPVSLVGASSRVTSRTPARRLELAQGIKGETFPRAMSVGSFAPTAGDCRVCLVGLLAGQTVTNVLAHVTVTGTGVTLAKAVVYDRAGNLVASSANVSASFNSGTGLKVIALSTAYTAPADDGYYLGFVFVGGTSPTILRGTSGITGLTLTSVTGGALSAAMSGQTDAPTTHTLPATGTAPWYGWS